MSTEPESSAPRLQQVNFRIPRDWRRGIQAAAEREGMTVTEWMRDAFRRALWRSEDDDARRQASRARFRRTAPGPCLDSEREAER